MSQRQHRPATMALIDSGIDQSVADIHLRVVGAYRVGDGGNVVRCNVPSNDLHGHGTRMASIVRELSPDTRIVDIGVLDGRNTCTVDMLANAVNHAVRQSVDVITLALSCLTTTVSPLDSSIRHAVDAGIVVVAAYRNVDAGVLSVPAALPGVIGVRRSTARHPNEWMVRTGRLIEVGAYSGAIDAIDPHGRRVEIWGNSSACAIMSAHCCNWVACHPGLGPRDLLEYLCVGSLSTVSIL